MSIFLVCYDLSIDKTALLDNACYFDGWGQVPGTLVERPADQNRPSGIRFSELRYLTGIRVARFPVTPRHSKGFQDYKERTYMSVRASARITSRMRENDSWSQMTSSARAIQIVSGDNNALHCFRCEFRNGSSHRHTL